MPTTMIAGTPSGQAAALTPCQIARNPRNFGCSRGKSYFTAKMCDCTIRASPMMMPGRMPPISNAPIETPTVAPYTTIRIDGGITTPMVEVQAVRQTEKRSS